MESPRDHCIRCGECCLKSSPTLQKQDLLLVKSGFIKKKDVYTIRRGELVKDNINDDLMVTPIELIKIKTKDRGSGECVFYDKAGKACTIYEQRPAQCVALKCWDTEDFMRVYRGPKAARRDVVENEVALGMMEAHERRCGYFTLREYVKQIESDGEKALTKILDQLKFDFHLRPFITQKLGFDPDEMDFILGRPLIETIKIFGLKVIREPDGSFLLTTK